MRIFSAASEQKNQGSVTTLTEYCRSVTIVTKTKTTFFTRKIDQFHLKTGQFRHFFEVKNVVNFSNSSRQYSVKDEPFVEFEIRLTLNYCIFQRKVRRAYFMGPLDSPGLKIRESYTINGVGVDHFQAKNPFTYFQTPTH